MKPNQLMSVTRPHLAPALDGPAGARAALLPSRVEATARLRFTVAQALAQNRIGFDFQPVVRTDNHRMPAFYEILARLRLPNGTVMAAGAFIEAVATGPLGREIDRLALREALRVLAREPRLRVSINLSPLSMGDEAWLDILAAAHRGNPGICARLILEISEDTALADAGQVIEFMGYVRRLGPAFALDDFGAGATGFRHFKAFRFDMVKIDGAFVGGVDRDPDNQVLLRCLATLARHFEMMTIAERVERPAEALWLQEAGVDAIQGYLVGRPAAVPVLSTVASRAAAG